MDVKEFINRYQEAFGEAAPLQKLGKFLNV